MAAIGINMEKKKIQEIKNGVVTKATVIDYRITGKWKKQLHSRSYADELEKSGICY